MTPSKLWFNEIWISYAKSSQCLLDLIPNGLLQHVLPSYSPQSGLRNTFRHFSKLEFQGNVLEMEE